MLANFLFSKESYRHIISHVPRIAHATVPGLARALIGAGLKADLAVPSLLDLFIGKVSLVLGRHFGPDLRPCVSVQDIICLEVIKVLLSNSPPPQGLL